MQLSLALLLWFSAAQTAGSTCADPKQHPKLQPILELMDKLPRAAESVWRNYRPAEQTYVFFLKDAATEGACATVWSNGRVVKTLALVAPPSLQTPLYGFHVAPSLPAPNRWRQPDAISKQLLDAGVQRAVLVPVEPEIKLPFPLAPRHLADIAIHEGFHVNIQAPSWAGTSPTADWPWWNKRHPDRQELVAKCYGDGKAIDTEKEHLLRAVRTALSGGDQPSVCSAAKDFIRSRGERWAGLGTTTINVSEDVASKTQDARPASCSEGESVMELEEGTADFVAWMTAFNVGMVTQEQLLSRFGATQKDRFYLTGAMQLTLLRHLLGADFPTVPAKIIAEKSWDTGAIFTRLVSEVSARCGTPK